VEQIPFELRTLSVTVLRLSPRLESTSVRNCTDTVEIGSHAPDFSLGAANREGTFTLAGLLTKSALILEFLRGTW